MPTFPSSSPVDTMDRFRAENDLHRRFLSPNLLINPGFQHIEWVDNTFFDFAHSSFSWDPVWLRYAPGWFPFGPTQGTNPALSFSATRVNESPLRTRSGIEFTLEQNRQGGLWQEIPNAEFIRGRRVRVSGCYALKGTPSVNAGISVWLKGQKASVNTPSASAWVAGSIGYDQLRVLANGNAILKVVPGLSSGFDSAHSVAIPCYDGLSDDGVDRFIDLYGGETAGTAGSVTAHDTTVWMLADGFSGTPATDGSYELYSESQGVAGTYYFEEFVDIPDTDDLFEDNICYIVVCPENPGDLDMDTTSTIQLFAINLEVVLDDVSLASRVLQGALMEQGYPLPFGDATGRFDPTYLSRNPIYVPKVVPLFQGLGLLQATLAGLTLSNLDTAGLGSSDADGWPPASGYTYTSQYRWFHNGSVSEAYVVVDTPHVPPGASVVSAGVTVHLDADPNTGGYKDLVIVESMAAIPTGYTAFSDNNNARVALVLQGSTAVTGAGTTTTHQARARRNRAGLFWDDENADALGNGTIGAAEHMVRGSLWNGARIHMGGGWLLYAHDPRLMGGAYLPEP